MIANSLAYAGICLKVGLPFTPSYQRLDKYFFLYFLTVQAQLRFLEPRGYAHFLSSAFKAFS